MTDNEKKVFIELTNLVTDCTLTLAKVSKLVTDQVKDLEKRLSKCKELLDQPQRKEK